MEKIRHEDAEHFIKTQTQILKSSHAEAFRKANARKAIEQQVVEYNRCTPEDLKNFLSWIADLMEKPDKPKAKALELQRRQRFPKRLMTCPITGFDPTVIDTELAKLRIALKAKPKA